MTQLLAKAATVLLLLSAAATRLEGQPPAVDEHFRYRWELRNLLGTIAALFMPGKGEGELTFKTQQGGLLKSELLITSSQSAEGEYFRYGAEIDPATLQTVRAWSAYAWRGESKSKDEKIQAQGVLDIASGIYAIRRDPPAKTRAMEIWSDGKVYPVLVIPMEVATRKVGSESVTVRHFAVRGQTIPGRRRWKGKLDLWLTRDDAATPVEITISRNLADVRLELQPKLEKGGIR
jgi:hypothetical protein